MTVGKAAFNMKLVNLDRINFMLERLVTHISGNKSSLKSGGTTASRKNSRG